MSYVFGIDGGGTSSRLRLEDLRGGLLFYGEGGSTNPHSNSTEVVRGVLTTLFRRAYAETGLGAEDCEAGFVGSAGIDRADDRAPFAELVRRAGGLLCPVAVGNDAEPALVGALGDTEGILLIAGTGSIAYGRARDGFSVRAGGWGHLLGDEGSAFRIAFDALARGMRSAEGRDLPTRLLGEGLSFFALREASELVPFVYGGLDKSKIASFARVVAEARGRGDPLAVDLFTTAVRELALLVESVYSRIEDRLSMPRLVFRGGLIEADAWLRTSLRARLAERLPRLEILQAQADAATGACRLARELLSR